MKPIERREFFKSAMIAGAAVRGVAGRADAQAQSARNAPASGAASTSGGWLALEKWITPAVYAGLKAEDEYSLCEELGKAKATARLKQHRETWITADDFQWLAAHGLNAVRLPVNYGIAEENPPFITGIETLDWAFRTAKAHRSGRLARPARRAGQPERLGPQRPAGHARLAHQQGEHRPLVTDHHGPGRALKDHDNLIGIELLNEPRWDVPLDILKKFYIEAYHRVREHISKEKGAVVMHDAFRALQWADFMSGPDYANVILDTHPYQCFTDDDRKRKLHQQVEFALVRAPEATGCDAKATSLHRGRVVVCPAARITRGPNWLRARRRHAGVWRCSVDQFRRHPRLVLLDVQDRGRGCVELPRLRQARLDAGEV